LWIFGHIFEIYKLELKIEEHSVLKQQLSNDATRFYITGLAITVFYQYNYTFFVEVIFWFKDFIWQSVLIVIK